MYFFGNVSSGHTEEIDLLEIMFASSVELLEEKGIVTQQEWEKRIKERVTIE